MRSAYAIKLNIAKYGKRPTSATPVEPMLVQLGNGEIMALCLFDEKPPLDLIESPAPNPNGDTAKPMVVEIPIDLGSSIKMEVRPNGTYQECILTIMS